MKTNLKRILQAVLITGFTAVALSACILKDRTFKDANSRTDQSIQKIHDQDTQLDKTDPAVVSESGYYVNPTPVPLEHEPEWLSRPVNLEAQQMPLDQLINQLLVGTNVNSRYDDTVDTNRLVNIHYHGTIKGALNTLAAKMHIFYDIDAHTINWSTFQTRTFNIAFMPGTSNYFVGQQQGGSGGGGGGGFYSQQGGDGTSVQSNVNDSQYSNLQGELSVWADLREGLNQLKSPDGTVVVSEATTSVTVHDHPDNVEAMSLYIKKLNQLLSQQVAIKVEVIDVTLNNKYNLGIDWDVIANTLDTQFNFRASLSKATDVAEQNAVPTGQTSALSSFIIGRGNAKTFINALSEQGKLNVVTRPQVVTLNNQIASIRITTDTAYVKSVSTTVVTQGGTTSSIEPGTVTQGFTLYVLPKIKNQDIYMQISSTLSNLISIVKESNEPTNDETSSNKDVKTQPQFVAVQVPTLAQKVFNQRSVVRSGTTLVIAGFKQLRDQTDQANFFGVPGGQGADTQSVETLVLITPVVLSSSELSDSEE